jgi:hypothetical protein
MPHACRMPTVSSLNTSFTGVLDTWLASSDPQHTGWPSVRRAQTKLNPGATWVNVPGGTLVTLLFELLPQQVMLRSTVTPQAVL